MNYVVFDLRGLLLHSYHRCTEKTIETEAGFIPSWEDGLAKFVVTYLDSALQSAPPRQIIACLDGGNTARSLLYFDYKAKRKERDREENKLQREQIKLLMENGRRLLAYLGCRVVRVPGEEADDLIGLIVSRLEAELFTVHTRDKDLLQLVSDKVQVVQCEELYWTNPAFSKTNLNGVPFSLVPFMKAVVGDPSDGYPGIKGCGEKFFQALLEAYGESGLLQLADMARQHVPPQRSECKLLDKLIDNWADLVRFLKVSTINPDFCYGSVAGAAKRPEWYARVPDKSKVTELILKLGLLRPGWDRFFPTETLIDASRLNELPEIMKEVLASPIVSYDFESSDKLQHAAFRNYDSKFVDVLSQEITSISINYGDNLQKTIYLPFDHRYTANLPKEWGVWVLDVLSAVRPRAVVQNAAFELSVALNHWGKESKPPFDTAIMATYVDENEENHLKGMSKRWLNYDQATYAEVTQGRMMCELTALEAISYGCDDSLVTSHLFDVFRHILQCERTWEFYAENETDWAGDSSHSFVNGTEIDFTRLAEYHEAAKTKVSQGMAKMHESLAANCGQQRTDADVLRSATALLDEWWSLEQDKYASKPEAAEAARQKLWEQAWSGCFYTPPVRQVSVRFSPTAHQLTAVANLIDKALPPVKNASKKGITEWVAEATEAISTAKENRVVGPLAREFVQAVSDAAEKGLSAKPGQQNPALARLIELGVRVLEDSPAAKVLISGDQLNTNSPKQMQQLLYGKLGLPIRRRSKITRGSSRAKLGLKGSPATGIKAIQAARVFDVTDPSDWRAGVLDAYYEVAKTSQEISLYYETYPLLVHPRSGRIHPQIRNCGTVTRRPTGTAPNVLQVSKGPLRTLFTANGYDDEERVIVSADFSSQELLILACESKDPVMLEAFKSSPRLDLHAMTAAGFAHVVMPRLGVPLDGQVDYSTFFGWLHQRDNEDLAKAAKVTRNKYAKACNFLIAYGGGPTTLAENLLIPVGFAEDLMAGVFNLYSRIQPWQEEMEEFAKRNGYTLTAYGNRRHAPKDMWASEKSLSMRAARQVTNAVIQSTAADILKVVLTEMSRRQMRERYSMKAIKPVYDEITASVPARLAVDYALELTDVMTVTPPGYPVAMGVDVSIGKTWGSVAEVGDITRDSLEKTLEEVMQC